MYNVQEMFCLKETFEFDYLYMRADIEGGGGVGNLLPSKFKFLKFTKQIYQKKGPSLLKKNIWGEVLK